MSTPNEGAYGFDVERIDNPNENDFILLAPGKYAFRVKEVEKGWHNGSEKLDPCHKAIIHIEVDGGWQGKVIIKTNYFLHRKMDGLNCQFMLSIGHRKHGEPLVARWNLVPGSTGVVEIGNREGTGESKGKFFNDCKKFLEPGTALSVIPQPAPAQGAFPWEQAQQPATAGVSGPGDDGLAF